MEQVGNRQTERATDRERQTETHGDGDRTTATTATTHHTQVVRPKVNVGHDQGGMVSVNGGECSVWQARAGWGRTS